MRPVMRYGSLFGLALVLFLLLLTPAHLVSSALTQRWPQLHLQRSSGSVIHGRVHGVQWRNVSLQSLSWRWQPLELFSAWLALHIQASDPHIQLVGSVASNFQGAVRGQQLRGSLPLADALRLAGQSAVPAQGMVEFEIALLRLDAQARPQQVVGTVRVLGLEVNLGQALRLGDFTMQLHTTTAGEIVGAIRAERDAALALEGILKLATDGNYTCTLKLAAPDASALRLALTQLLGAADANGNWTLRFAERIR